MMGFFRRRPPAKVARERLQILLAHERALLARPDLLGVLREEILAVIGRHVTIEPDKVHIKMDHTDSVSMLEIDIEIPSECGVPQAAA
jgi:cell division topological specificity factor